MKNNRFIVVLLISLVCVLTLFTFAWGASPRWNGTGGSFRPAPNIMLVPESRPTDLTCPNAYSGVNGDMLPTGWETVDKGQPARLVTSQVQGQDLFCVYEIPSKGRMIHASVHRIVPEGIKCISDGAGKFECRPNGK